ncbi:hypothetical protein, partial [Mesorhizobium sp. M7A.F.Ca.CA.004.02.1.1]
LCDLPEKGPIYRKEGKQTQPVSFVEKAGFVPGPSAYGLHMAEFAAKCKGRHAAAQQNPWRKRRLRSLAGTITTKCHWLGR